VPAGNLPYQKGPGLCKPVLIHLIVEKLLLFSDEPFAPILRNHKLSGKLKDLRAIAIESDCRVVFKYIDKKTAMLINIGSHESLFEKLIIKEIPEL